MYVGTGTSGHFVFTIVPIIEKCLFLSASAVPVIEQNLFLPTSELAKGLFLSDICSYLHMNYSQGVCFCVSKLESMVISL